LVRSTLVDCTSARSTSAVSTSKMAAGMNTSAASTSSSVDIGVRRKQSGGSQTLVQARTASVIASNSIFFGTP
jgi:hypothetical protein